MRILTNATIASVLLASALTACAHAQDPGTQKKQTFQFQRSQGDGKSIELRVENGEVRVAKVNGEDIPADRVRKVSGGFDIVDGSGKVVEHVAIARESAAGSSASGKLRRGVRIETSEVEKSDADRAATKIVPGQRIKVIATAAGDGERPKSMIGAGLGVPDGALAHHLGIDPSKSTLVTYAIDGLPASKAGIEQFDVIVSINGSSDASSDALRSALRDAEPGTKIKLGLRRGAETKNVEVEATEFDESKLEAPELDDAMVVPGMSLGNMLPGGMLPGGILPGGMEDAEDGDGGANMMFFVGPDGKRHEMRMPVMPNMPMNMGMGGMSSQELERRMEEFSRRMEEWSRRMEQRMRERGPGNNDDGEDGDEDAPIARITPVPPMPGQPGPQVQPRVRPNQGPNSGGGMNNDERVRRLEERMDRLMRELERERNERRDGDKKNDA